MSRAYVVTSLLVIGAIVSYFYMNFRISELEGLINRRTSEIEELITIKPTVDKIEKELVEIHKNLRFVRRLIESNTNRLDNTVDRTKDLEQKVRPGETP